LREKGGRVRRETREPGNEVAEEEEYEYQGENSWGGGGAKKWGFVLLFAQINRNSTHDRKTYH
jgi:hypothetical protein